MKTCGKCGIEKEPSEFNKDRNTKDGLQRWCRDCFADWHAVQREAQNARRRRHGVENRAHETEKKRTWRLNKKAADTAHGVVRRAVLNGDLPPIVSCRCKMCGRIAGEYHHVSYEEHRWLDVIPLCRSCHRRIHAIDRRRGNE